MYDKRQFWDKAAKSGLVLGGISILFMLISLGLSYFTTGAMGVIASVLSPLFWIVKLVGCIYLLRLFLKKFYASFPDVSRRNVLNQGRAIAFLSAAIYAAFNMAFYMYINPGFFEEALTSLVSLNIYSSAQIDMFKEMAPQIPTYAFFGTLIYCYLFGVVVSSFVLRKLFSSNPFNNAE